MATTPNHGTCSCWPTPLPLRCPCTRWSCASAHKHDPLGRLILHAHGRPTAVQRMNDPVTASSLLSDEPLLNSHWRSVCSMSAHSATSPTATVHDVIVDHALNFFTIVASWHNSAECRHHHTATMLHCRTCSTANHCSHLNAQPRRSALNSLPTELKLLQSITTSRFRLKTFPLDLPTDTGKQSDGCFVVHPWSPSRMRNINHCYSYSYTPKTTVLTVIRIPWFSCSLIINDEHRNSTEKQHNTTLSSISKTQPGRFPSSSHCAAVLSFAFSMRFTMMTNFVALHNNKTAILYQTTRKRKPIQILVGTKIKWLAVKKCVNNLSEVPVLGLPFPCTIATRNENSSVLLQTMGKSSSRYIMW